MKPKKRNQKSKFVVEVTYSSTPDAKRRLERVFHLLLKSKEIKERVDDKEGEALIKRINLKN